MSRKSIIERQKKRESLVVKYTKIRNELKKMILDPSLSAEERYSSQVRLQKITRDASKVRLRNRCAITGRPRGVYRKFGLARNKLRELAMQGVIPGLTKASW